LGAKKATQGNMSDVERKNARDQQLTKMFMLAVSFIEASYLNLNNLHKPKDVWNNPNFFTEDTVVNQLLTHILTMDLMTRKAPSSELLSYPGDNRLWMRTPIRETLLYSPTVVTGNRTCKHCSSSVPEYVPIVNGELKPFNSHALYACVRCGHSWRIRRPVWKHESNVGWQSETGHRPYAPLTGFWHSVTERDLDHRGCENTPYGSTLKSIFCDSGLGAWLSELGAHVLGAREPPVPSVEWIDNFLKAILPKRIYTFDNLIDKGAFVHSGEDKSCVLPVPSLNYATPSSHDLRRIWETARYAGLTPISLGAPNISNEMFVKRVNSYRDAEGICVENRLDAQNVEMRAGDN
jgi:hypothetical protein